MPGRRNQAKTCRRKACNRPRHSYQFLCSYCWAKVPGWLQRAIVKARKSGDHEGASRLRLRACAEVDNAEDADAIRAVQTYERTQSMLGERPDDGEAGE